MFSETRDLPHIALVRQNSVSGDPRRSSVLDGRTRQMKCTKCSRTLVDCPSCDGGRKAHGMFGKLTCSTCNNTGYYCPEHHGHHGR